MEDEIAFAVKLINDLSPEKKACLCFAGYSVSELDSFAVKNDFATLDGVKSLTDCNVFISDLEQMKGFEFDTVIILNCNNNLIPNPYLPDEESFRDICRLYVAMTRSKNELIISYSSKYSHIFEKSIENGSIFLGQWDEYYSKGDNIIQPPERLPQFTHKTGSYDVSKLSGKEFLYTDDAFSGLSKDLLIKIESLVDGRGAYKGHSTEKVKWKTIGDAYIDVKRFPHAKQLFGYKLYEEFLEVFKPLMSVHIRDLTD